MTPAAIILFPLLGGVLAWIAGYKSEDSARRVALVAAGLQCVLVVALAMRLHLAPVAASPWLIEWRVPWIPQIGASLHLAADGLSLIMLLLTAFLGFVAVLVSGGEAGRRRGAFQLCLLSALSAVSGVFLAVDLLLFFVFFEAMLVPVYFLIILWGDERGDRFDAALKFFLFTQASGLVMLVAMLALSFLNARVTGQLTLDAMELRHVPLAGAAALLLPLGFFLAFAVKLPLVPLHSWQPVTYAAIPASGGILLSGIMAKVGAYGMLRFVLPLFHETAASLAPWAMGLAVISILYGAVAAFAQAHLRRFIACSSISHLGFVVLGIFSLNELGQRGAVVLMVAHGCSVAGLFVLAEVMERNGGSRDMSRLGGLWADAPRLGAFAMVLVMATLGLPGLANFVGEFLVLLGAFRRDPFMAALAALGTVLSATYALRFMQQVFFGARREEAAPVADLSGRHAVAALLLVLALLGLGLFPGVLINGLNGGATILRAGQSGDWRSQERPRLSAALDPPLRGVTAGRRPGGVAPSLGGTP